MGMWLLLLVAACTGRIDGEASAPRDGTKGSVAPSDTQQSCGLAGQPIPESRLWRLSDRQYRNAIGDLLGGIAIPVVTSPGRDPYEFINVADRLPVDGAVASLYHHVAQEVAEQFGHDARTRAGCASGEMDKACATRFIPRFLARAFRRPPAPDEIENYVALYESTAALGFAEGMKGVVETVLQAPSFVYRIEVGVGPPERRTLDAYETASALSFFLTDSIPDTELWQAAEDGSLLRPAGRQAQVDRLLSTDRAVDNMTAILMRWLKVHAPVSEAASGRDLEPGTREALVDEVHLFIRDALIRGGDVPDLFTRRTLPVSAVSAPIYGIKSPGPGKVATLELPAAERAGLLTMPGFIASMGGDHNRSIHRGLRLRRNVLCGEIPSPDGVDTATFELEGRTERQRTVARKGNPTCAACHGFIDPVGLAFEHYDPVGRYVLKRDGAPVDASGTLIGTNVDGPFSDVVDLSSRLAGSAAVQSCLASRLLSYANGYNAPPAPACADPAPAQPIALRDVFRQIALSRPFLARQEMPSAPTVAQEAP